METENPLWLVERHVRGHAGAEVPAVRAVALVAEAAHERVPQPRRIASGHASPGRTLREPVARQRGDHHVEAGPVDPMGPWIGEQRKHRQELDEGARPAVGEDEGYSVAAPG